MGFFHAKSSEAMVAPQVQPIAFELIMVEHQMGVQATARFLMQQKDVVQALDLGILIAHSELVRKVLGEHDAAKVNQTPEFLKRYHLNLSEQSLSTRLSRFYGIDLSRGEHWPKEMTLDDGAEAFKTIRTVNRIDQDWMEHQVRLYMTHHALDAGLFNLFTKAIYRLELVSDLMNRKMLEETLYERFWITYKNDIQYLFEFGHPFELDSLAEKHWKSLGIAKKIALKYSKSNPLKKLLIKATSAQNVVQRYHQLTENSPYYTQSSFRKEVRELELQAYLDHRAEVDQKLRQYRSQSQEEQINHAQVCKLLFRRSR